MVRNVQVARTDRSNFDTVRNTAAWQKCQVPSTPMQGHRYGRMDTSAGTAFARARTESKIADLTAVEPSQSDGSSAKTFRSYCSSIC